MDCKPWKQKVKQMCNRYNESKWNELDDTFMYGKKEGKKVGPTKKRTEENRNQKKRTENQRREQKPKEDKRREERQQEDKEEKEQTSQCPT